MDGTYQVNRNRFPLYTIMVRNGNGHGQAVAQALVADEKRDLLRELFAEFKKSVGEDVKTILIDKDFNEIEVLTGLWPEASLSLCRFHVLKVSGSELGISNATPLKKMPSKRLFRNLYMRHHRRHTRVASWIFPEKLQRSSRIILRRTGTPAKNSGRCT